MKKRRDPDDYCPICDALLRPGHQCSKQVTDAIDAAHEAAGDEDSTTDGRTYDERVGEGFDMLRDDFDGVLPPIDYPEDLQD